MPDIIRGNVPQYIPVRQPDIIKPSAYQNSTVPYHQKGHVNGHHTLSGASAGSAFGPYGAAIGALVGLGTDIWQSVFAKKRAKEANVEAKKAADTAAARNSAEARAARNYNSEQAQIRRMRMAGLSPGLAYGQMSPSTAQAPSIDKQDVNKADTPKFDNESILHAIQLLINQQNANTQAAAQESAANLQGTQADLNRIEQGYKAQLGLANIASLLSSKDLNDQQKLNLIAKQLPEIELLQANANASNANARQSNANADVVEQTGVDLAKSQTSANKAAARNTNATAQITEDFGAPAAAAEIARNTAVTYLTDQQRKSLMFEYNLKANQYKAVQNWLSSHGFDESYAPLLMLSLENLASSMGTEVTSLVDDLVHFPADFIRGLIDRQMQVGSMMLNKIR